MKVMTVFGTRPEAIKMCPLVLELKKNENIEVVVCLTGQHKEMLEQVMDAFMIKSNYNLNIMKERQSLEAITEGVMSGISNIIDIENPDCVLVHGDTTTSFAAGLAAFYKRVPVGHVEAGLRTYDITSPFPEEFNRRAVDLFSELYFAPTEQARVNLISEGIAEKKIYITGNTVIDALKTTVNANYLDDNLKWAKGTKLILMTAHRRENLGKPMQEMFKAVRKVLDERNDLKLIYPVHKNPIVREVAYKYLGNHERIRLIEPLEVFAFHNYIEKSFFILTDSGGIQEEAPALGKPVLVMRENTERPEGVKAGTLKLIGTSMDSVYNGIKSLIDNDELYQSMSKAVNPYGDGHASERITEIILNKFMVGK